MSETRSPQPKDPNRVNITIDYEVQYWCAELRCTEAQLRDAVSKHGDSIEAIRLALKRQGGANFMESDG